MDIRGQQLLRKIAVANQHTLSLDDAIILSNERFTVEEIERAIINHEIKLARNMQILRCSLESWLSDDRQILKSGERRKTTQVQ